MRTTVNLPDDLLREAKAFAAAQRLTLGKVLEEGIRRVLADRPGKKVNLRTSNAKLQPGIDLNDNAELLRAMDEFD